jgi:alkylation response protein AidB-like acyl-CoA dehydrogenase
MDFDWTPEQAAFRTRVRAVIQAALPPDWAERSRYDTSSAYVSQFSRSFCPMLAKEGLLIPHWPRELGGGGLDAFHHWILGEEMFAAGEPRSYQYMNVNWVGPAIIRFGDEAQRRRYIGEIASGEVIWCQGFSEPSAGSDLAALSTRAERRGDDYVLNGSKVWTSGASLADYCFLLARTGEEPRTRGISVFLLPTRTPGIEIRPIPNFMGEYSLHEVFLNDVVAPAGALLGEADKGWDIVRAVLHNERIGAPRYALSIRVLQHAVDLLQQRGADSAPARAAAAQAMAGLQAARQLALRVIDQRVKDRPADGATNLARYALISADRLVANFLCDFLHGDLVANTDPLLAAGFRRTGSTGLAAGSAEVQLNLIAGHHLDLPTAGSR